MATQLEKLKIRIDPNEEYDYPSDDYLNILLDEAESKIMNKRYPSIDWTEEDDDGDRVYPLESKYYNLQIQIAIALYNRIGAEGESQHTENGVSRTYQSGEDVSDALLNSVIPLARVI